MDGFFFLALGIGELVLLRPRIGCLPYLGVLIYGMIGIGTVINWLCNLFLVTNLSAFSLHVKFSFFIAIHYTVVLVMYEYFSSHRTHHGPTFSGVFWEYFVGMRGKTKGKKKKKKEEKRIAQLQG